MEPQCQDDATCVDVPKAALRCAAGTLIAGSCFISARSAGLRTDHLCGSTSALLFCAPACMRSSVAGRYSSTPDPCLSPFDRLLDPPFGGSCPEEIVPRLGARRSEGARPLRNRRSSGMATATAAPVAG